MCGLTGGWTLRDPGELHRQLRAMTAALHHRGPDSDGLWFDPDSGFGLGHARLAIVDLSPQGHQPMLSASGRYVVAYNGEIYNHADLRNALGREGAAPAWRGHSDTETLLAAIERWGLEGALQRCIGMFAVALWDRRERELWLARDRLGEKPLYYGLREGRLLFASELKALDAVPGFLGPPDRDAVALFLRRGSVPAPYSIHEGVAKLRPGHWLRLRHADLLAGRLPESEAYWRASDALARGRQQRFQGSAEEAVDALEALLGDAVGRQMMADVPLGAFLSGGVDSSTIVALMQRQSTRPVRTFSIGFHEEQYDEARFARAVAGHLGTAHTELYVSPAEAMSVIPELPRIYDEPFADSSQIPTLLVSRMARQHVTVSLSGDAGDELFLGYHRYRSAAALRRTAARIPPGGRRALARLLRGLPAPVYSFADATARALRRGPDLRKERMLRLAAALESQEHDGTYGRMVTHWEDSTRLVPGASALQSAYDGVDWGGAEPEFPELLGRLDLDGYLTDDILVKVDRAAMSVGLETRIPMLDHRVVEFAQSLPPQIKWHHGEGKWPLRALLRRHVPAKLVDRPKRGFGVPTAQWLRGPLRGWAEDLLSEHALGADGLLDPAPIRRCWQEHLSGRRDAHIELWDVLMLQAWLRERASRPAAAMPPESLRTPVGWR
jgi:asparagine synthase (glutamine-hydrolysing)